MGGLFQNSNLTVGKLAAYAPIQPSDYSGLFIWLDASDLSTITTGSVNAVSTWSDKSGGGRNFTQATAGSRPTYQTASFNGNPSINFDGSSDFLTYASNTSYNKFTVFAVLNVQNNVSMQQQNIFTKIYFYALGTSDFPFAGIYSVPTVTSIGSYIDAGGDYSVDRIATSSASPNTNYIYSSYYDQVNLVSSLNGVVKQTTPSNISLSSTIAPYAIGRSGLENGGGTGTGYYKGNLAELIMYTSSLSTDQQNRIRLYLGNKWGISTI